MICSDTKIEFRSGNIFDADVEALVNTVNCVGVMGRGIALQFKKTFPDNFRAYAKACEFNEVRLGKMFVFETNQLDKFRYIINFPTKNHWRKNSRIEDIEAGLDNLTHVIRKRQIHSIAIPSLGCGLGGLDWQDVRPQIESALKKCPNLRAVVFEPTDD